MTDSHGKRKFAGPTIAERRKTDERDKRHLSPHQKPRTWTLTIEWSETMTFRRERKFTTRAARDESRRRIERHFKEVAAKAATPRKYRSWWPKNSPFADYDDEEVSRLKTPPVFIETHEEGS